MSQYSLLKIPPYHFLIPLHKLKEVQTSPNVSPVPQAPPYVLGLFPIRGELCTLLCLPTLLGFTKPKKSYSKTIILDHHIGLLALDVVDVDIISFTEEPQQAPLNLPISEWVSGMYSTKQGDFFLLNFSHLQTLIDS